MKRCGLYTRVSTEDQVNVKDGSLDTQVDLLQDYVDLKDRSSDEDWRVIARYREEGRSGKDTNRPEYRRMLRDVEAGKIDTLLCTKLDRVSRSLPDFYALLDTLERHDVAFVSLKERWDTTDSMGRFALKMVLIVAELEREQTSERTSQKAAWRAKQGLKNGGQVLGYDIAPESPGVPTVNEEEKALVLLIYHTYLKLKGLRSTAQEISGRGYRTKAYTSRRGKIQGGKRFSDMAVRRILANRFYIGQVRHRDKLYDGQHEPIVPVELFERVQRTLEGNRGSRGRPQERHLFTLDGLVRCGFCEAYMTPTFSYNNQKKMYSYYACTNRQHRGGDACDMKPVAAEPLEEVIVERLIQLGQQDRTVERIVQEAMSSADELLGNLEQRRSILGTQQTRVQEQIDALVEGLAGRKTSIKSVGAKIVELEEQKEELDDELLEVDLEVGATKQKAVSAQSLTESLTTFGDLYREATPEERRELIRLRVNQLIWTPDEIRLALLDSPEPYQGLVESHQLVARTGFEPVLPA